MATSAGTAGTSVSDCVVDRGMQGNIGRFDHVMHRVHRDCALGVAFGEGCGALRAEATAMCGYGCLRGTASQRLW